MHFELTDLVRDALISGGCSADIVAPLDPHSPIELAFKDTPPILISLTDEKLIRLDSQLTAFAMPDPYQAAPAVFPTLVDRVDWSVTDALSLRNVEGLLILSAVIRYSVSCDKTTLMTAISSFYDRLIIAFDRLKS